MLYYIYINIYIYNALNLPSYNLTHYCAPTMEVMEVKKINIK